MRKKLNVMGLAALFALVNGLVACNLANGLPTIGKNRTPIPGHVLVGVSMKGEKSFPSYRAAYPKEWGEAGETGKTSKADLLYSIYEYKSTASDHGIEDVTKAFNGYFEQPWDKIKSGRSYIDIPAGGASLIMVAVEKTNKKRVLISGETKITVPGPNYLEFVLRPYRDAQDEATAAEPGKVDIKFIYFDPVGTGLANVDKVSIILTKNGTVGTDIPAVDFSGTKIENYSDPASGTPPVSEKRMQMVQYKQNTVVPGVYNFKAVLYKNTVEFASARDLVIVDPANTTQKVIKIDSKLDTKPTAPVNFRVRYARPGKGDTNYKATFTWQDTAYNEDNFILEVKDAGGTAVTGSPFTLGENIEKQAVTLELTKKYTAAIYAKNTYGTSDEVAFTDIKTGKFIHLARITYDLEYNSTIYGKAVQDENDPLSIKDEGTNEYVSYYSAPAGSIPVQLPGPVGLPYVFCPAPAGQLIVLKGYTLTPAPATNPTEPRWKLEANSEGNITAKAVWNLRSGTATTFPLYNDYCVVEGGNNIIEARLPAAPAVQAIPVDFTIDIATVPDYKVESVKVKLNAADIDPATAVFEYTADGKITSATDNVIKQAAKITFKKAGAYNVLFEVTLVHNTDNTKKRLSSATCCVLIK